MFFKSYLLKLIILWHRTLGVQINFQVQGKKLK